MIRVRVDKFTEIDLVKCPHILIGGSTGSGKSYLMKSILCDILGREGNEASKVIVIDPKSVDYQFLRGGKYRAFEGDTGKRKADWYWSFRGMELIDRDGIDYGYALKILSWLCDVMTNRYRLMTQSGHCEWGEYVKWLREEDEDSRGGEADPGDELEFEKFGGDERLIVMIDELTDLTYWDRDKERGEFRGLIEKYLVRIAMLGRAAGIHLILGTQRPDAQTLSGQLRANIPTRICLRVANKMERRIVLGSSGEGEEREMVYQSRYSSLVRDLR